MAILIDRKMKVLVQGITGREGSARTRYMLDYGTRVVAGCAPGRGGQKVEGVPVFDTVGEACATVGERIDVSVMFVPGPQVKPAALEAFEAGVRLVVLIADRVPLYDVLEIVQTAELHGGRFLGPNTAGAISPGKAVAGILGGSARSAHSWFLAGPVGLASRSGGLGASAGYYLGQAGIGLSTLVHVGGDAIVGLNLAETAELFEGDPHTRVIVLLGEIGTSQEEQVAERMRGGFITKPVVTFIGGRAAQAGTRYSHSGAIIEAGRGTYKSKFEALREAGAWVTESFEELPKMVRQLL
jgi:succinyl-CoA synthetase alpha subunit